MNKIIKVFVAVFALALSFVSNSCDKFDTFALNVPFSIEVVTQGNTNPTSGSTSYCLTGSDTYSDYVDDIEKLTYVEAAWRTADDANNNIIAGVVSVTVRVDGGPILFSKTIAGANPSEYKSPNPPFILSLTAAEIQLMNDYLATYLQNPNQCLRAEVQANSTNPATGPYYLKGIVDLVVEAETKL